MIITLGLLAWTIGIAGLSYRFGRARERTAKAQINASFNEALIDVTLLPSPDDERWERCKEGPPEWRNYACSCGRNHWWFKLGFVFVTECNVLIDRCQLRDLEFARRYGGAVRARYMERRALASIEQNEVQLSLPTD